jgi:hypothetical protein
MPIATITSVNLPTHQYPHVEVKINDNTLRRYTTIADEYGKTLCVFRSPKGPDGIKKITGLQQFVDTYGEGSVAQYGQPLLNARTMAATNAITQYCLRVTADDAKVANLNIYARYRVRIPDNDAPNKDDTTTERTDIDRIVFGASTKSKDTDFATVTVYHNTAGNYDYINTTTYGFEDTATYRKITIADVTEDETTIKVATVDGTDEGVIVPDTTTSAANMQVYFVAKSCDTFNNASNIASMDKTYYYNEIKAIRNGELAEYDPAIDDVAITEGDDIGYDTNWKEVRLMTVSSLGKGVAGNTISFAIISDNNRDKSNAYKNYWFQIYEGSTLIEKFAITLTSNGKVREESKYICNVVNDDDNDGEASTVLKVDFNEDGLIQLHDTYNDRVNPGMITYDEFDVFFGKDKKKAANKSIPDELAYMTGYEIVSAPDGSLTSGTAEFIPYAIGGTPLESGNDGNFELTSNGGTAESATAIITNVNKAYRDIFGGKSTPKIAHYATINTAELLKEVTYPDKSKGYVVDQTVELPDGGVDLYFDAKNNYLVHAANEAGETLLMKKVSNSDEEPIFPNQSTEFWQAHQYVQVYKRANVIQFLPVTDWIPNLVPASISDNYPYPDILTKNKTEIDFFLDANYDFDTKLAICDWVNRYRSEDFVVYLDAGVSDILVSKVDAYTWVQAFDEATNGTYDKRYWYFSIDAYYGRIKDPFNSKIVEVTSTYNLARHLVTHWAANGGKHIPYAGSLYAVIDSYLPMSVFPLMDEGLDSEHMDRLIEEHVNYAQVNSRGDVIRATQSTRYPILGDAFTLSNLTELNNVHIVLDIKKDVEHVLELFSYQFNETSDLKRFNTIVSSSILPKYSAAQVKSISAQFNRTSEEAEYGILHLYIEVVHKNLVKIIMVDIDVNRNTD